MIHVQSEENTGDYGERDRQLQEREADLRAKKTQLAKVNMFMSLVYICLYICLYMFIYMFIYVYMSLMFIYVYMSLMFIYVYICLYMFIYVYMSVMFIYVYMSLMFIYATPGAQTTIFISRKKPVRSLWE